MTVLCGTDFSEASRLAVRASAAWARKTGAKLELAHAVDLHGAFALLARGEGAFVPIDAELERWRKSAEDRLAAEAAALAAAGLPITTRVLEGAADAALVTHAARCNASLIVVGAIGARAGSPFTLGSTADRVAQSADRPVLVVRDPAPIERWSAGSAPLRALLAIDDSNTAAVATAWAAAFTRMGGVELSAVHVFWPPDMQKQRGAALQFGASSSEAEQALARGLEALLARRAAGVTCPLSLVGGLGRTADHLTHAAAERRSELVVVGAHQRGGLKRFWHGSVSHGVIDRAGTNVVVVPERG